MNGLKASVLVLVIYFISLPAAAWAQDERAFRAAGVADTEEKAVVEAYYQGLARELARFAGAQAEGDVGQQFRRDFERDFATFRQRYFTPDTDHRCVPRGTRVACEVEGTIKVLALQTDFTKVMKTTERTLSNHLTFIVSAAEAKDPRAPFVIDKLTAVFLQSGYQVLSSAVTNKAIEEGKVDFSLAVQEMSFSAFAFDAAEQKGNGSLSVRFRLNDLRGRTQVASVPVNVNDAVAGPSLDVVRDELASKLAAKAATEIGRQVNAAVVNFQVNRDQDAAAVQRQATGAKLYLVRLNGIAQRDRDRIRVIREVVTNKYSDATPQVDPSQSNSTRVTLTFSTAQKMDPESLLDDLFAAHRDIKTFEATFVGNNEFQINY
jgi:hypothetical protein